METTVINLKADAFKLIIDALTVNFKTLDKEGKTDLLEILQEATLCSDPYELDELFHSMAEILFPSLIGTVQQGNFGEFNSAKLKRYVVNIGKTISRLRRGKKWTQLNLAKKSGLMQSHISRLELGQHSPSHKTLKKIAGALRVNVSDIDPSYND